MEITKTFKIKNDSIPENFTEEMTERIEKILKDHLVNILTDTINESIFCTDEYLDSILLTDYDNFTIEFV